MFGEADGDIRKMVYARKPEVSKSIAEGEDEKRYV